MIKMMGPLEPARFPLLPLLNQSSPSGTVNLDIIIIIILVIIFVIIIIIIMDRVGFTIF